MLIIILILLLSCSPSTNAKGYDLSGPHEIDGKCFHNLGHRVGGDFKGLRDNRIKSALKIKHLESHRCFNHWEFDVASTKKELVVYHDRKYDGHLVRNVKRINAPKLKDFSSQLTNIAEEKPMAFDLKHVTKNHWNDLINIAMESFKPKFIIHVKRKDYYKDLFIEAEKLGIELGFYK